MKHKVRIFQILSLGFLFLALPGYAQTVVCMNTNLGDICMELLQADAPRTTARFLHYVDNQSYTNTLIHETAKGSVNTVSGGRFKASIPTTAITSAGPLASEFTLANQRGTVAMTVNGAGSDSADNGWFINVSDNPVLDSVVGATVFGRIIGNGMRIVDVISKLPKANLNSSNLSAVPVVTMDKSIGAEDLVNVLGVQRFNGTAADYEASLEPDENGPDNSANLTDVVCMATNLGEFCLQMFPEAAPQNVANFLQYVRDGDYDNTFFHRSIPGFVIQGGGFRFDNTTGANEIPKDPTVVNEYQISNTQGTVAMAKLEGNPDSASSEWFINLADNSTNLDNQNGGFTVFAKVAGNGMSVVELIARVGVYDLSSVIGGTFNNVPLVNPDAALSTDDFVTITRAYETQKDLTLVDDTLDPTDPASRVTTLTNYGTGGFMLPVRVNDKLYQIIFNEQSVSPPVYRANTKSIIQLVDNNRPAATLSFSDKQLLIPSIRIGTRVYTNIELALTDSQVLEFTLISFDKL